MSEQESIFRKAALERLASPERLDDRLASPDRLVERLGLPTYPRALLAALAALLTAGAAFAIWLLLAR